MSLLHSIPREFTPPTEIQKICIALKKSMPDIRLRIHDEHIYFMFSYSVNAHLFPADGIGSLINRTNRRDYLATYESRYSGVPWTPDIVERIS